jgi:hypothetical protein
MGSQLLLNLLVQERSPMTTTRQYHICTLSELRYVQQNYQTMSDTEISQVLAVTPVSVRSARRRLGVFRKPNISQAMIANR